MVARVEYLVTTALAVHKKLKMFDTFEKKRQIADPEMQGEIQALFDELPSVVDDINKIATIACGHPLIFCGTDRYCKYCPSHC